MNTPSPDELDAAEAILDSQEGEYEWLDWTPDVKEAKDGDNQ